MRIVDFSYKVLRSGAFYGYLQAPLDGTRVIRMDDSGEIKESLSGTFSPLVTDVDGNQVEPDWLRDEIQPCIIINGKEYSLGVFSTASVIPSEENGIKNIQIEAYDRCWRVRDNYTDTRLFFAAGTNYINAIESLLIACGISTVMATPTSLTLAESREDWDVGTSYLTIVNQLLQEINYNSLFFTPDGMAVLSPAAVPTVGNINHRLSDEPNSGDDQIDRMLPSISRETDIYQAPNVFLCICNNPEKESIMTATAENTNPQSPLSISRRGRRIVEVRFIDNIASQEELQAYADRVRNESMISGETIRVSTALLPGYNAADVVALRYGDLSALCIERAFVMELRVGGAMTHELERVVYNFG